MASAMYTVLCHSVNHNNGHLFIPHIWHWSSQPYNFEAVQQDLASQIWLSHVLKLVYLQVGFDDGDGFVHNVYISCSVIEVLLDVKVQPIVVEICLIV